MTKKLMNLLVAAVLVAGLAIPTQTFAQPQDQGTDQAAPKAGAQMKGEKGEGREAHPVIRRAIRQLQGVKTELEKQAAHDFAGHRVAAIKSIDEAIEHLNQALASDKK